MSGGWAADGSLRRGSLITMALVVDGLQICQFSGDDRKSGKSSMKLQSSLKVRWIQRICGLFSDGCDGYNGSNGYVDFADFFSWMMLNLRTFSVG